MLATYVCFCFVCMVVLVSRNKKFHTISNKSLFILVIELMLAHMVINRHTVSRPSKTKISWSIRQILISVLIVYIKND